MSLLGIEKADAVNKSHDNEIVRKAVKKISIQPEKRG